MPRNVAVVVLGDVGRSPRMQYHCISLASLPDTRVSLVGYEGEPCVADVETNRNIQKFLISVAWMTVLRRLPFLLYALIRVPAQILQLFWTLMVRIPSPQSILVQNPPSIPALAVVWLVCRLRRARMVIDWHNFGYSVLAMGLRAGHPLVNLARVYERFFAGRGDAHLCVTRAMQQWLERNWGVRAVVLYDRAPAFFHKCSVAEEHELFSRLAANFASVPRAVAGERGDTLMTANRRGDIQLRVDRPALIISSTSWTADEDFGILLNALVAVNAEVAKRTSQFPHFVVVVTGKGPQRAMYEAKIRDLQLAHVTILTMWMAAADYPLILGCADLGVCLHTSTSGLDLPMKVVDMFGCQLPVCAVGFDCLHELVQHNQNGLIFQDASQLAANILDLFRGFPANTSKLDTLRAGVRRHQTSRWSDNWTANAAPIFTQ